MKDQRMKGEGERGRNGERERKRERRREGRVRGEIHTAVHTLNEREEVRSGRRKVRKER